MERLQYIGMTQFCVQDVRQYRSERLFMYNLKRYIIYIMKDLFNTGGISFSLLFASCRP